MTARPRAPAHTDTYKWFALGILMLVGLTNYMDRLSISILQVPIKVELGLSDTQLGAITGLSFSLVYTLAAIPIARLADRRSPKQIIVICLIVWNALTMLCGLAGSFLALAVLRMGVAIGEAGCGPTTQALLANYFPHHQRGRAIALWQMVFPMGSLIGIFGSGLLSAALGWRTTFLVLGGAGLLTVPLVILFLREPQLTSATVSKETLSGPATSTLQALREILSQRAYRLLLAGGLLAAIPLNAVLNWNAPFYGRAFSLPLAEVSYIVAMTAGIGGILGVVGGGFVSDLLGRRDQRWYCWLPGIAMAVAPLVAAGQFLFAPTPVSSMLAGLVCGALLNCWMPPQAALGQLVVRSENRALSAACILVTAGLGAALGPFIAGVLSDFIAARSGDSVDALRQSLALVSLTAWPAALLFFVSATHLYRDLERFREHIDPPTNDKP